MQGCHIKDTIKLGRIFLHSSRDTPDRVVRECRKDKHTGIQKSGSGRVSFLLEEPQHPGSSRCLLHTGLLYIGKQGGEALYTNKQRVRAVLHS